MTVTKTSQKKMGNQSIKYAQPDTESFENHTDVLLFVQQSGNDPPNLATGSLGTSTNSGHYKVFTEDTLVGVVAKKQIDTVQ